MAALHVPQVVNLSCSGPCFSLPPPPPPWVAPSMLAVYYATTPVLPNETVMVAGAGMNGATAKLCKDEACLSPLSAVGAPLEVTSWNKSVKVILPASGCGPPCFLQLKDGNSGGVTTVTVNQPDVWWVTTGSPGSAASPESLRRTLGERKATVAVGDSIRVFGRALGWTTSTQAAAATATELICASGKVAPVVTQTKLTLLPAVVASTTGVDSTGRALGRAPVVLVSTGRWVLQLQLRASAARASRAARATSVSTTGITELPPPPKPAKPRLTGPHTL